MENVGEHQYITYLRLRNPEAFYIEGTYSGRFLAALKASIPARARYWDPCEKRWEIQKEYLPAVKALAKEFFDVVYYGEGGDYVTL